MSRDFIGTSNRDFAPSPNRDRIVSAPENVPSGRLVFRGPGHPRLTGVSDQNLYLVNKTVSNTPFLFRKTRLPGDDGFYLGGMSVINNEPLTTIPNGIGWYRCTFRMRGACEAVPSNSFTTDQGDAPSVQYGQPLYLVSAIGRIKSQYAPDWTISYMDATPSATLPIWSTAGDGFMILNRIVGAPQAGLFHFENTLSCSIAAGAGAITGAVYSLGWSRQVTGGILEGITQGGSPPGDYNTGFPDFVSGFSVLPAQFMRNNTVGNLPSMFSGIGNIISDSALALAQTTILNYQFLEVKFTGKTLETSWRPEVFTT